MAHLDLEAVQGLLPGTHVVVLSADPLAPVRARKLDLEFRDALLVIASDGVSFAFLFRKSCSEPTVAENVLKHGTGALNIDACRVGTEEMRVTASDGTIKSQNRAMAAPNTGRIECGTKQGRWPSNLVFIHGNGCRDRGSRKVRGQNPAYRNEGKGANENGNVRIFTSTRPAGQGIGHADTEGFETVAFWECAPGCLAPELDNQSGTTVSKRAPRGAAMGYDHDGAERAHDFVDLVGRGHDDFGGASRFYPQFESVDGFRDWLRTLIGGDGIYVSV